MKKSFLKNFIVLGLFSIFLLMNINFANAQTASSSPNFFQRFINGATTFATSPSSLTGIGAATNFYTGFNSNQSIVEVGMEAAKNKGAEFVDDTFGRVLQAIIKTGAVFALKIIQFLMFLSGKIFDLIIKVTIEEHSLFDSFKESLTAAWKILRDIANIFIVFSLLYLGIKTILNGNGFAEKKVLLNVLLAAVLINFSLVITQTVFEVSNLVGDQIANQITFTGKNSGYGGVDGISSGLMGMIKPDNIMNMMWNNKGTLNKWEEMWNIVQTAIFTGVTLLFMIVIFFTASIMLMYRFILFIVLMITSPFGLISKLVPWFDKIGVWWWKTLKTQAIVLPAFFLTLYISILFVSPLTSTLSKNSGGLAAAQSAGATIVATSMGGAVEFFFSFFLIIGFLLLPLLVPGKVGAAGSSMMTNAANWTQNKIRNLPKSSLQFAGGAVAGGMARAGRQVGGRLIGGGLSDREDLKRVAQGTGIKASLARQTLKAAGGLRDSTYDIRNTKAGANLGFGKGITNWSDAVSAKKKKIEDRKAKEGKALGFDDMAKTPAGRAAISAAEQGRDIQAINARRTQSTLRQAEIAYANATAGGGMATIAQVQALNAARTAHEIEKDKLEKEEIKVGKAKMKGDVEYLKLIKARQKRWYGTAKYSLAQQEAIKKIEKELEKKYKEAGKKSGTRNPTLPPNPPPIT